MEKETYYPEETNNYKSRNFLAPCIGKIAGSDNLGRILVSFDGYKPKPATLVANLSVPELSKEEYKGCKVLLIFENGDPDLPILTALMSVPLEQLVTMEISPEKTVESKDLIIDGKKIRIEAEDEIILTCGSGSIMLKKDGKIVIKGEKIISRANGLNLIEGGATRLY